LAHSPEQKCDIEDPWNSLFIKNGCL